MFRTSLSAVIGLALVLAAPTAVAAQSEASGPMRTIVTSGTGTVSLEPDEAVIRVGVDSRAQNAQAAMRRAARQMDAVIAALRDAGVADEDIQTVRLDLNQVRQRNAEDEVVERGWRASNQVRATIRDIDGTSDAIDAAVGAGATRIDSVRFRASDNADVLAEARVAAVESASTAAATMAAASGLEVLGVLTIVEGDASIATSRASFAERAIAETYSLATPIEPGLVDVTARVTVEYEIG
jgi:hypothetical protein